MILSQSIFCSSGTSAQVNAYEIPQINIPNSIPLKARDPGALLCQTIKVTINTAMADIASPRE